MGRSDDLRDSEDCLYLNVYTPAASDEEMLPVLMFIPGGAFMGGASNRPQYDGEGFCKRGVVVVTINYRTYLSAFHGSDRVDTCLRRGSFYRKFRTRLYFLSENCSVSGMRCHEYIIHTSEQFAVPYFGMMRKDSEQFLGQWMFTDPIVIIHTLMLKKGWNAT